MFHSFFVKSFMETPSQISEYPTRQSNLAQRLYPVLQECPVPGLRSVYADRFVLSLINKRIVSGKNFSKKENGAVLMDDDLRKKLLTEWQNKKKEVITHPYLKEKVEWGMVPYVQAMLLARYLRGDLDGYPVFLWK